MPRVQPDGIAKSRMACDGMMDGEDVTRLDSTGVSALFGRSNYSSDAVCRCEATHGRCNQFFDAVIVARDDLHSMTTA